MQPWDSLHGGGLACPVCTESPPAWCRQMGGGPTPCLSFPIALYPLKLGLGGPEGGPTPCPIAPPAGGGSTRGSSGGSAPGHSLAAWGIWGMKGFWGGGCMCMPGACVRVRTPDARAHACVCVRVLHSTCPGGGLLCLGPPQLPTALLPCPSSRRTPCVDIYGAAPGAARARAARVRAPRPRHGTSPSSCRATRGLFLAPTWSSTCPGWARAGGHGLGTGPVGCRVTRGTQT